mmetsp:Transcript_3393/g.7254  ORF Transcript_3393/g.7254 Transcript_3393/m.7254 type:complete len:894 (-) Transcript_3393:171-2852(-)
MDSNDDAGDAFHGGDINSSELPEPAAPEGNEATESQEGGTGLDTSGNPHGADPTKSPAPAPPMKKRFVEREAFHDAEGIASIQLPINDDAEGTEEEKPASKNNSSAPNNDVEMEDVDDVFHDAVTYEDTATGTMSGEQNDANAKVMNAVDDAENTLEGDKDAGPKPPATSETDNDHTPELTKDENGDESKPSAASSAAPTPLLIGTLSSSTKDGVALHTFSGHWTFENVPDSIPQRFELIQKFSSEIEAQDLPKDGEFEGSFDILYTEKENDEIIKTQLKTVIESGVNLTFVKKDDEGRSFSVKGEGVNEFGGFELEGSALRDENGTVSIQVHKRYTGPARKLRKRKSTSLDESVIQTTPRKRTKKFASLSMNKSRGRPVTPQKSGSKSPKATPGSGKKDKVKKLHRDSGKRYGLGKPDLYCDCCFLEEDKEIGQTPFIKCIHCGLIAHSACYPPLGKVDDQGNFLCDVCTFKFHPSINRTNRHKHASNASLPPGPLSENADAKNDGRIHKAFGKQFDVFCELCKRRDVIGGMKPTDSHSWVHLACLMAAEGAYFQDSTATGVGQVLKLNKKGLGKFEHGTGLKPRCEGCNGEGGMLLLCMQKGCNTHLHALCAEILDRARVVDHIKERDVLSYKCGIHSYEGLDACGVCGRGTKQEEMLDCDKCHQGYHMGCLNPPLTEIPDGYWFCDKCLNPPPEEQDAISPDVAGNGDKTEPRTAETTDKDNEGGDSVEAKISTVEVQLSEDVDGREESTEANAPAVEEVNQFNPETAENGGAEDPVEVNVTAVEVNLANTDTSEDGERIKDSMEVNVTAEEVNLSNSETADNGGGVAAVEDVDAPNQVTFENEKEVEASTEANNVSAVEEVDVSPDPEVVEAQIDYGPDGGGESNPMIL